MEMIRSRVMESIVTFIVPPIENEIIDHIEKQLVINFHEEILGEIDKEIIIIKDNMGEALFPDVRLTNDRRGIIVKLKSHEYNIGKVYNIFFKTIMGYILYRSFIFLVDNMEKAYIIGSDDYESFNMLLEGSKEFKVRPIGLKSVDYKGILSDKYFKSIFEKNIYLEKDDADIDIQGRLLRYIWIDVPLDAEDIEEIQDKMLNAKLILSSYANLDDNYESIRYGDILKCVEKSF